MKSVRIASLIWGKAIFHHRLQANPSLPHANDNHPTRFFSSRLILFLRKGNTNLWNRIRSIWRSNRAFYKALFLAIDVKGFSPTAIRGSSDGKATVIQRVHWLFAVHWQAFIQLLFSAAVSEEEKHGD